MKCFAMDTCKQKAKRGWVMQAHKEEKIIAISAFYLL